MKALISENVVNFTDIQKTVKVTCGGVFGSMDVTVNIFINKTDELRYHHRLTTRDEHEETHLIVEHSAPVGIIGMDEVLPAQCKSYIKSMVSNPYYVLQVTAGDPTTVCRDVLQVVYNYFLREKGKVCESNRAYVVVGNAYLARMNCLIVQCNYTACTSL